MRVRLGELTMIRTGKLDANAASEDGAYPFFTCSKEPLKISTYSYDCECVLVAGNGDLNVKYYNGKFDAYQRTYIIESNRDGRLYLPYLYYFMARYIQELRKLSIGGVIKYIKLGNLIDAEIKLPNISQQKEICNRIKQIESIISKKKQQLINLDNLIKARFVEMFGKIKNGIPIEDSGLFISDGNYSAKYPRSYEFIPSGIPFIRANNIKDGTITDEDMYFISSEKHMELRKGHLLPGDVLITTRGSIGQLGIVPSRHSDSNINAQIVLLRDTQGAYLPEFLLYALQTFEVKKQFIKQQTGTTLKQLPVHNLKKVVFVDAPIDLQHRFASFVHQVDKSKFAVQNMVQGTQR